MKKLFKQGNFISVATSAVLSFFMIAAVASASTTIDSNVNTGGTLDVTGATTLTTLHATGAVTLDSSINVSSSLNGPLDVRAGLLSATTSVLEIYGGTGQTSYTAGDLLYASAVGNLSKLGVGATPNGKILSVSGGIPAWIATSTMPFVASTVMTASGDILYGGASGAGTRLGVGTGGYVLGVSGGIPAWIATTTLSTITGTLAETKGGTNQTTYTMGDLLYASAADTLSKLAVGATPNGKILSISGGIPAWIATSTMPFAPTASPTFTGTVSAANLTVSGTFSPAIASSTQLSTTNFYAGGTTNATTTIDASSNMSVGGNLTVASGKTLDVTGTTITGLSSTSGFDTAVKASVATSSGAISGNSTSILPTQSAVVTYAAPLANAALTGVTTMVAATTTQLSIGSGNGERTISGISFGVCTFNAATIVASSTADAVCTLAAGLPSVAGHLIVVQAPGAVASIGATPLPSRLVLTAASSTAPTTIGVEFFNSGINGGNVTLAGNEVLNFISIK